MFRPLAEPTKRNQKGAIGAFVFLVPALQVQQREQVEPRDVRAAAGADQGRPNRRAALVSFLDDRSHPGPGRAAAALPAEHLTIIVREPNNPFVRPLIDRLRGVAGGGRVPKGKAGAKKAIQVLRSGRVLGLLFDQKLNSGIPVPLFGIEAMTAPVPAQLALRMGCPLIPVRIERTGAGRFRITAHAALELPDSGDRRADAARLMLELNRILEDWIRAKPEEWFWLHRRWPDAAYLPRGTGKSGSGV